MTLAKSLVIIATNRNLSGVLILGAVRPSSDRKQALIITERNVLNIMSWG